MKNLIIPSLVILSLGFPTFGQKTRDFTGKSRGDFFGGARDYREITKNGLQISFGPNFTLVKGKDTRYEGTDASTNRPIADVIDPAGSVGAFINVGMAHYRLKPSRILESIGKKNPDGFIAKRIKSNLWHRFDWGLGFDYIGGKEKTTHELYNPFNELTGAEESRSSFYNGYLTARFTADRFRKIGDDWHLETGLGFNANYNILSAEKAGYAPSSIAPQKFQKDFMIQMHTHVGFNYRVKKGDYLTFGFYMPILGLYEMNKLKPTIQWHSSNYYPAHLQVKWIHHFTKKQKGCNTPGTEEDRKKNQEYLQNN